MIDEDYYGGNYRWFSGVVKEVVDDDRVKVRIFGVHRINDTTNVSDGDLPIAFVVYPVTSSGGTHSLTAGDWVTGFFADGDDCQQPVVTGKLKGGGGSSDNSSSSASSSSSSPPTAAAGQTNGSDPGSAGTPQSGAASQPGTTGSADSSGSAGPSGATLPGNTNAEKAYNFIREKIEKDHVSGGNVHAQVCGIIGNLEAESNWKITACNPNDNKKSRIHPDSIGLCQWNDVRAVNLKRSVGESSSSGPTKATLEQQLDFMWKELKSGESLPYRKIMAASNYSDAVEGMLLFERPYGVYVPGGKGRAGYVNRSHPEFNKRNSIAAKYFSSMKPTARST